MIVEPSSLEIMIGESGDFRSIVSSSSKFEGALESEDIDEVGGSVNDMLCEPANSDVSICFR